MKLLKGKDKSGKPVSGTAKAVVAPAAEKLRLLLIINPVSGKLKARASMFDIIWQLAAAGFETTVALTEYRGHARELAAALDEVSEEHRRIVLLRDVSGMSYTEIAEILEISEGTVKSRLARARIALRKVLLKRGNILPPASSNQVKGGGTHE